MRFTLSTAVILGMLTQALPAFAQSVEETEPNDTPATADTAARGDQVKGRVGSPPLADTVDYWAIHVDAGDTLYAAVDYCPYCIESGFYIDLSRADGTRPPGVMMSGMGADPQLAYVAEATGWYFVRIRFSGLHEGQSGAYTLTFRNRTCPDDPNEPNGSLQTAKEISLNADVLGRWCPDGDRELFRINAHAGDVLEFWLDSVVAHNYYGWDLHLLDASGRNLDSIVQPYEYYRTAPGFRNRYEFRTNGTFYLEALSYAGNIPYSFHLHLRSAVNLPPGPGDPTTEIAGGLGDVQFLTNDEAEFLAADDRGNLWIAGDYEPIVRVWSDGSVTKLRFPPTDAFPYAPPFRSISWDAYGNAFFLTSFAVVRFIPPDRLEPIIVEPPTSDHMFGTMALRTDGFWLTRYGLRYGHEVTHSDLLHYDLQGRLLTSTQLYGESPYAITNLTVGPGGALYYSFGDAIYRVTDGGPIPVLQHAGVISAFAFDSPGNIYVADTGSAYQGGFVSRVTLYSGSGSVITDPFSWWSLHPRALAFGRNADGTPNRRLFIIDRLGNSAKLLELNPAGIQAPGLASQGALCPRHASEAEPNDSPQSARVIATDTVIRGVSCPAGDQDYFHFVSGRTGTVALELTADNHPTLELLAADGSTRLSYNENSATAHVTLGVKTGETYFVHVGNWIGGSSTYVLRIGSPLTRPEGLTLHGAARELIRPNEILNSAQRTYLDQLGNNDGRYDVGDFRAFLRRERAASGSRP